uniref:Uncharacterized protein n=1 Tax=Arundo donax TaxID=35708 RepID=A0A0A8XZK7_ARUDO
MQATLFSPFGRKVNKYLGGERSHTHAQRERERFILVFFIANAKIYSNCYETKRMVTQGTVRNQEILQIFN